MSVRGSKPRKQVGLIGLILALVATALLVSVQSWLASAYLVVSPGMTLDLSRAISVNLPAVQNSPTEQMEKGRGPVESQREKQRGGFLLTSVSSERAGIGGLLRLYTGPAAEIKPVKNEIPEKLSMEKYFAIMDNMMAESQTIASAVALKEMGYLVEVSTVVVVEEILDNGPASGVLQPDDIILAVDTREVRSTEQLVRQIRNREIGDPVQLKVLRRATEFGRATEFSVTLPTTGVPDQHGVPGLGIMVGARHKADLPFEISFDCGPIKGASAGLMFALQIVSELKGEDLSNGHKIAGTGTLDLDGRVGRVDGVRQKAWAAKAAGAEYFLCPAENELDLRDQRFPGMTIVPVEDFRSALRFLENL